MKWLFQNVRQRAGFALRNPRYAAAAIFRELKQVDEKFLAHVTGSSVLQIRAYLNEPISTPEFAKQGRRRSLQLIAVRPRFSAVRCFSLDLY